VRLPNDFGPGARYRPGRNAQQAVVKVEELLFRGHPEVVDADLADYFGSIPHALDLFRFNRLRDLQNSIRQGSGCRLTFTLVQQIVISNFDYPAPVGQRLCQSYFAAGTCAAAQF
jgi:hypothetical protein